MSSWPEGLCWLQPLGLPLLAYASRFKVYICDSGDDSLSEQSDSLRVRPAAACGLVAVGCWKRILSRALRTLLYPLFRKEFGPRSISWFRCPACVRVCVLCVCVCRRWRSTCRCYRSFPGGRGEAGGETTNEAATAASARGRTRKRKLGERSIESGAAVPAVARQQEGKGKGKENVFETEPIHEIRSAPACWHMRGRLTNAATGQTIALVEGVELARSLTFETANSRKSAANRRDRGSRSGNGGVVGQAGTAAAAAAAAGGGAEAEEELEVDKVLKTGMWTAFGALASSKFFMYQVRNIFCCLPQRVCSVFPFDGISGVRRSRICPSVVNYLPH